MKRNVFIDFWRSIALVLMVCFHIVYDLNVFLHYDVSYNKGFWRYAGFISASLFIFISGLSIGSGLNKRIYHNAGKVALAAIVVSIGTYFFDKSNYVIFGILHFMAVSSVLAKLLLPLDNRFLLVLAGGILLLGEKITNVSNPSLWLLPLGIVPQNFTTVDYYPLIPWFALFILGLVYGKKIPLHNYSASSFIGKISFLGRHTLLIYLVHQPIILLVLFAFKQV